MARECPKCKSPSAWFEKTEQDILLRCTCGYLKVMATKLNVVELVEGDDEQEELRLPKRGTHLWVTLMVLASLEMANSAEITVRLNEFISGRIFTVSDVSSYLTILRSKGLVRPTTFRRGLPGGSTWVLTDRCVFLIGL